MFFDERLERLLIRSKAPDVIQEEKERIIQEYRQNHEKCDINVRDSKKLKQNPRKNYTRRYVNEMFDVRTELNLADSEIQKYLDFEKLDELQWFIEAVILKAGSSFGELALINNAPRRATIKCLSDCTFAILNKNQYNKAFQSIEKKQQDEKIKFIGKLPFISHWTRYQI